MSLGKSLTRISQKVSQRGVSEGREYVAFLIARDSGHSVPSQKLVVYIGEQSAALARRADDGIREYSEEAQRCQRRRGPARYARDFWDGTLDAAFNKYLILVA
jgi:hypothetical protein